VNKWDYINLIRRNDSRYGHLLLELMDKNNKDNLLEITESEAKEFYEELRKRELEKFEGNSYLEL
jgi:hypothetical protein